MTKTRDSVYLSMKRLYKNYIRDCRRRNVFWGLDIELFHKLTSAPCVYCGKPPSQITRAYTYTGIDRMNSARGYEPDNCVSCCKECNGIKSNRLTFDEMKAVGQTLTAFRKRK